MSASPAGLPGTTPNGAPAGAPPRRRRPAASNPLVTKQRGPRKPAPALVQRSAPANGTNVGPRSTPTASARQSYPTGPAAPFVERPRSPSPPTAPQIIPVFTTRRALLEGLRHHVARLQSKDPVDVTDEEVFTRPIRLHRRDPRIQPGGGEGMDIDSKEDLLDEKERERMEAAKLERQRIREENAKLIAPAAPSKKKPQAFKKKVEQVYRTDDNPEDRKRSQLRYEEALPWHIEDFDNKHIWQGSYEAALSECHVMLMESESDPARDAYFRLVPVEKWYKFREKNKIKHRTPEEVEAAMSKKFKEPKFLMKQEEENEKKKRINMDRERTRGLFQRSGGRDEIEDKAEGALGTVKDTPADADDIDFNIEEEFADDEENPIFEGDDDTQKQAEERIKRDQLGANVFGMTDEQEVDEEAEREKKLAELTKQLEKGTRKALLKREKNFDYETDSDGNPYSSESESEDSDAERLKEEERKKEEEQKGQQFPKGKEGEKPASGTSTKGSNTPSGRKEKHGDALKKSTAHASSSSLKRPGSPNLSEASGNESSRKKSKKHHGHSQSGSATPRDLNSRQSSFAAASRTAGSGSETDGPKTKIRLVMSPKGTPRGSRAGSPAAGAVTVPKAGAGSSRASSPPNTSPSEQRQLPTKEEVLAQIPDGGISLGNLINRFAWIKKEPKETQTAFIKLVKENAKHTEAKLLVKKT